MLNRDFTYSPELKMALCLEVAKKKEPINVLADRFQVPVEDLGAWYTQFLAAGLAAFRGSASHLETLIAKKEAELASVREEMDKLQNAAQA